MPCPVSLKLKELASAAEAKAQTKAAMSNTNHRPGIATTVFPCGSREGTLPSDLLRQMPMASNGYRIKPNGSLRAWQEADAGVKAKAARPSQATYRGLPRWHLLADHKGGATRSRIGCGVTLQETSYVASR